jgi:hypothetical protein|tara:strand:+ start:522 stop:884 length:363 start_codon:yes stop_codon:yes gene_type:complete
MRKNRTTTIQIDDRNNTRKEEIESLTDFLQGSYTMVRRATMRIGVGGNVSAEVGMKMWGLPDTFYYIINMGGEIDQRTEALFFILSRCDNFSIEEEILQGIKNVQIKRAEEAENGSNEEA